MKRSGALHDQIAARKASGSLKTTGVAMPKPPGSRTDRPAVIMSRAAMTTGACPNCGYKV